ncbi:MAG: hypothetical protein H6538_03325 [Bacteroidales bacterium]|nr:hypothetical protein [Bacteroidales bacterium]MCB8999354.1 hypothetical protein [Bacteroidales bacterium]MCB9013403.1 hypothetical protein [Bacteroidales bacterium]
MKSKLLVLLFLASPLLIHAQDTIFMKSGVIIPAKDIVVGDVEIRYKKYEQTEPAGIYTVFKEDVSTLHYSGGKEIVFPDSSPVREKELDNKTGLTFRLRVGLSENYFNRDSDDKLLAFWRYHNQDPSIGLNGKNSFRAINLSMLAAVGGSQRHWMGAGLQLIATPKKSIFGSNYYNGLNEINLRSLYYNISFIYGRSINYKKNLVLLFKPSLDIGLMSGEIILYDISYKESMISGMGSDFSLGLDWIISKRLTLNFEAGKRFITYKESHPSTSSSTGYANFYVNHSVNNDLVSINWGGFYFGAGLNFSFFAKVKA